MSNNGSSKFKIRFDDEDPIDSKVPEPSLQNEVENLRFKKLSRRINFLAVFLPCLLALILVLGYLHITKKFDDIHMFGSSDARSLSKDLDSKFSSLSIRQAKIEALLNEKISAMEKTTARIEQNLQKTEKTLSGIQSSAPDKEEIVGIRTETEKALAPLQAEIKKLSAEIRKTSTDAKLLQQKLDKDYGKLETGISDLRNTIRMLKADSADLALSRVDKKTFDLTVRHQERFFQQKLNDMEKSLSEKIESLHKQITALEDKQKKTAGGDTKTDAQKPVPAAPPPVESIKPAPPQPEKITEQEIKK